jgi:penicillin-binding protein 2
MFERRLKILLIILLVVSACLAIRAAQIQVLQRATWRAAAAEIMKSDEFVETTRGSIVDRNGVRLVADAPCIDASVDYRVITEEPDADWVKLHAEKNLKDRLGDQYKDLKRSKQLQAALDDECARVRDDIKAMWQELAAAGGKTPEQIDEIRRDIVQRVEMRKRYIWWHRYEAALKRSEKQNSSAWYRAFLADNDPNNSPEDDFEVNVAEETASHVILHDISPEVQARLARQQERFFGLSLVPSKYRKYDFGRVACNVLGYLQTARPEEITADAAESDQELQQFWSAEAERFWPKDVLDDQKVTEFRELRRYWPTDLVGRTGIEALCEEDLRGTRGKIERVADSDDTAPEKDQVLDKIDAVPGKDVPISIDIGLQQDIENEFIKTRVHHDRQGHVLETRFNQHGAAVVIKVDTGEVLALVSAPGYDPNNLDSHYAELVSDELNHPLLDRATEVAVVPGSTVKTIVGCGSITDGIMKATDKIQCRGELIVDGKPQSTGHCWIYAQCKALGIPPSHGENGTLDYGIGSDDMLTISDGIRDSCNVVFETIALRMGMYKLSSWFDRFGLGRKTGIGIEEIPGFLYHPSPTMVDISPARTWSAGIGEGVIQATPLQMANVAATIARNGIWMRPRLVADANVGRFGKSADDLGPKQVDLHLSREALDAVQTGMKEVCTYETKRGDGTGWMITAEGYHYDCGPDDVPLDQDPLRGMQIAGKTGSAQIGQLMSLQTFDADGKPNGHRIINFGDPGTQGWYLEPKADDGHPEKHLAHAWFIGYAPADHPQVAFCVLVEYGEAGNTVAGPIAHDLLVDCIKHRYLSPAK